MAKSDGLAFDLTFEEAAAAFAGRITLTREEFDQLAAWAKKRAFTVATVTKAEILQDLLDAVQSAIDDGLGFDEFQTMLGDIMDARGWAGLDPWHAETVFRTNMQTAYGVGRLEQQRSVRDEFPFLQYHAIHDSRTRPEHRALDGVVRAIGDPFWKVYYPPWDYNCRCYAESLNEDEARKLGFEPPHGIDLPSPNDFGTPASSPDYVPDLSTLDPALAEKVAKMLADFDPESVAP